MQKKVTGILFMSALIAGCNSTTYQRDTDWDEDKPSTPLLSQYWINYEASRIQGTDLLDPDFLPEDGMIPPNFSYAGYLRGDQDLPTEKDWEGYKVFNVTDFGAVANNGVSDKQAFIATADAVSEHVNNGGEGAIFYVPEGDFIVNSPEDMKEIDPDNLDHILNRQVVRIYGSNIVFKGAGKDKTRLIMTTHLLPESQSRMWTTPYLFEVGSGTFGNEAAVNITEAVEADTQFSIQVEDVSSFSEGDFVELKGVIIDEERLLEALSPYKPEVDQFGKPRWNASTEILKLEKHEIERIDGQVLYFKEPVTHDINPEDDWTARRITPAINVGVQDLTFKGSWSGNFVHHQSALGNSGYSLLKLARAGHSWIRDVDVVDFNQSIQISNGFNVTVKDVHQTGNPGHISLAFLYSNNVISKDVIDSADTWHGPGWSKHSTRNVHLRAKFSEKMGPDIHGAQAINNLFDQVEGNIQKNWGAAIADQPNHLQGLYFWNTKNTGPATNSFSFMSGNSVYGRIIMPHLVGLHGNRLQVNSQYSYIRAAQQQGWADYNSSYPSHDKLQAYVESNGRKVRPASLYEAQLKFRQSLQESP